MIRVTQGKDYVLCMSLGLGVSTKECFRDTNEVTCVMGIEANDRSLSVSLTLVAPSTLMSSLGAMTLRINTQKQPLRHSLEQ